MSPRPVGDPVKRRLILASARQVFIENGYDRACVDLIAERAEVSKATVYNHFKDKGALFVAAASEESLGMRARLAHILETPTGDIAVDLQQAGETLLGFLVLPNSLAFHRILRSEINRFPELGRDFFNSIQDHRLLIAAYLRRCQEEGRLSLYRSDAELAAAQFVSLCISDVLWRLELGVLPNASAEVISDTVQSAVQMLLRAYGV